MSKDHWTQLEVQIVLFLQTYVDYIPKHFHKHGGVNNMEETVALFSESMCMVSHLTDEERFFFFHVGN